MLSDLQVTAVGRVHLRLTWEADAAAGSYRIYRSLTPEPIDFLEIGQTGELLYDDEEVGADQETYFYTVRGVNRCGVETP